MNISAFSPINFNKFMTLVFFIIAAVVCAAVFIGDIHSSSKFDEFPQITEANKMFRNSAGDTNIAKLTIFKVVLFAGTATVATALLLFSGAGFYASFVFWLMSGVEIKTVMNNYRLIAKYREIQMRINAERAFSDSILQPGDNR